MTNNKPDTYLPKLHDSTACYRDGEMLVIHEHENDNAWIAGKPTMVRR